MHISYKPLWHTLLERDMRKEDLRLAAGMTTNMIANMSKEGKHISMDTLARICETLNCEITDVTGVQTCALRSEEHTSELQSPMRISYAVFCLKKPSCRCAPGCAPCSPECPL